MEQSSSQPANTVETVSPPYGIKTTLPEVSAWSPLIVTMVLGLMIILSLLVGLILLWKGRRKKQKILTTVAVSPMQKLSDHIQELHEKQKDMSTELFSSKTNLCIRMLVGLASELPCQDWTTQEVIEKNPMPDWMNRAEVNEILQEADLVCFAGKNLSSEQRATWVLFLQENYAELNQRQRKVDGAISTQTNAKGTSR